MAFKLKKDATFEAFGTTFPNAYNVVDAPRIDKSRKVIDIPYTVYSNSEARGNDDKAIYKGQVICQNIEGEEGADPVNNYDDNFSLAILEEKNIFECCYEYLATLEEFDNWESDI